MAKRRGKAKTFSDQLRRHIDEAGVSQRQVALAAGIDRSQLHRFYHGRGRLTNDTVDLLVAALRLKLVRDQR